MSDTSIKDNQDGIPSRSMTAPTLELRSSFMSLRHVHSTARTLPNSSGSFVTRCAATGSRHDAATERTSSSRSPSLSSERCQHNWRASRTLDVPENCGINNILQHFASLCGIAVGLHEISSHRNFVFDAEKAGVADLPDVSSICRLGCLHLLSRNGEVLTYHLQQERMYAQD